MPEFTLTKVDIPQSVVVRKPNPYQAVLDALVKDGGAVAFQMTNKNDTDKKNIESAIGHLQRGARVLTVPKSARKKVETVDGVATITVWLVDPITRDRTTS